MNETIEHWHERKLQEVLEAIDDLKKVHLPMRNTGLGLCDIGAKIALEEGKLEMLVDVGFIIKEGWEDEGDIDSDRELQRERDFDRIQRSIETGGDE